MVPYIGDFAEDATIYHYFNTFDSSDPSISVTITDLADTDLFVYKDGSITDIVTDGASVVIDFDGRTGIHKITIDTSAHADYAIGSDYMVSMNGTTIDGGTVTAALFTFSIENRYNAAADDLANGTDGLGAIKADTAAILIDTGTTLDDHLTDIKGTSFVKDTHSLIDIETYVDILDDATSGNVKIAADAAAILVDTATTLQGELDAIQAAVITNAAGVDIAADIIALKAETATILVDTATTLQGELDAIQAAVITNAAGVDIAADIIALKAETATILVDTATTLQGELDGIQADTEDIQTRLPAALVGGRMDANMGAISTSAAAADNLEASALGIVTGACEGTPTTTVVQTDLAEATDDHYIGRVIVFTSGNGAGEASDITDYTGATGTVTITAVTTAPAAADTFVIV